MKKLLLTALTCILVACCSLMVACGSSVEGTYKFDNLSYSQGGVTITAKAGEEFMGMTVSEDFYIVELKKDGVCTISMSMAGETESFEGTWKKDGDTIKLTADGETVNATLDGDYLTFESDGMKITCKK